MRQYFDAKRQYRDAILFFRMGDFYEMFYEDALTAARALDLTLTSRAKETNGAAIPMCGVPYHAADAYITKLVRKGFRVAVCEQTGDPRHTKGLVRREVVRVVSAGTLTDTAYLEAREPTFLLAIAPGQGLGAHGMALLDLSTGHFSAAEYVGDAGRQAMTDEIAVLKPREILAPTGFEVATVLPDGTLSEVPITRTEPRTFDIGSARQVLLDQFRTNSLDAFGLESRPAATAAAGALVQYVRDTQKAGVAHVRGVAFRQTADCLMIDAGTVKHLELVEAADGQQSGSLRDELDRTVTAMGARQLRAWLLRPLVHLERIQDRLDAVEELSFCASERAKLRDTLKSVLDVERLVARAALGSAGPRDLVGLERSVAAIPRIRLIVSEMQAPLVRSLLAEMDDLPDVRDRIASTLVEEPPALARDGGVVRDGFDSELNGLRAISRSTKQHIAEMEAGERARTGITSLKIRYNRVFGYYIEVSRSNLRAVPPDYIRKQTIAGGERFITPALKEYEEKVLGADDRIAEREIEIFEALRAAIGAEAPRIQDTARALSALDVLAALAETASLYDYTKPRLHDDDDLVVVDGRHPVVERHTSDAFVPNDVILDSATHQLVILTGPNMGGKSTYLRQTALIVLLAQAGSFVPAKSAKLPIVDRIFARVGASDNITRGRSTFMTEMQETAHILRAVTPRSLVLLDEIGRGTATFDGLSIAWAVAEYLATNPRARPKTLFATHYHELTDLADALPGITNYHVVVREWEDDVVFLRKVMPGRSDRSYGIQVARLAGLPSSVIARAREILVGLERDELSRGGRPSLGTPAAVPTAQPGLFDAGRPDDGLARRLLALDLDRMTPLEALALLAELKKEAE